ncbi:histidine kinase 5 [Artemisia annua]|uniref:Histidine kinase 5 n=1 Tax=Artemisia annua TaxID=35608 RepID=A0A2U1NQL1_ARTAN|nr:histidine kinase 5 [Artemisia annua]
MYVEPVFSDAGEKTGINYVGMEITDQVKKREKMVKLREGKKLGRVKLINRFSNVLWLHLGSRMPLPFLVLNYNGYLGDCVLFDL